MTSPPPAQREASETLRNTVRAVAGMVPGLGSALAVLVEVAIPDPRWEKLNDWVALLAGEISRLKIDGEDLRARLEASEVARTTLVEAFSAAQRTTSSDQRRRLAKLLVDGLSADSAAHVDALKLMRLFAALDEQELFLLTAIGLTDEGRNRLAERNPSTFRWPILSMASPPEDVATRAMHDMRVRTLMAHGLATQRGARAKGGEYLTWEQLQITIPGLALVRMTHPHAAEVVESPHDR